MHRFAGDRSGRRDAAHCRHLLQRHELQGQRESALRGGRCVPLRHPKGGAGPDADGFLRGGQAEFPQEPTAGPLPAHRQQAGHEAVRLQEGTDERAHQAEGGRTLGHTSVLQFPVSTRHHTDITPSQVRQQNSTNERYN